MPCKNCGVAPVSAIEMKLQLCISCIEERATNYDKLFEASDTFEKECKRKADLIDVMEKKVERVSHLMHAELAGQTSAQNGLGEDQNPFSLELDHESHVMWLAGWTAVDTRRKALQAHAVMTWAGGVLVAVNELAKGYGQQEIASKLEVVISKFGQFVQTE